MTEKLAANIDAEFANIEKQAKRLADDYWHKHWEVRTEAERQHWGYIGCRVRTNKGIPVITWYRARYWRARNKAGEKREPTLEHLKKGGGYSYTSATFRRVKAKQWEIDKAMELEIYFSALRREIAMLAKMRRYLHELNKAIDQRPDGMSDFGPAPDALNIAADPQSDQDPTQPDQDQPDGQQTDQPDEQPNPSAPKRRPGSAEPPSPPPS